MSIEGQQLDREMNETIGNYLDDIRDYHKQLLDIDEKTTKEVIELRNRIAFLTMEIDRAELAAKHKKMPIIAKLEAVQCIMKGELRTVARL